MENKSNHYDVLDQVGGTVGFSMTLEDATDLAEDIDGIVVPIEKDKE